MHSRARPPTAINFPPIQRCGICLRSATAQYETKRSSSDLFNTAQRFAWSKHVSLSVRRLCENLRRCPSSHTAPSFPKARRFYQRAYCL